MKISTHTPHARRDNKQPSGAAKLHRISTHTPHARRDTTVENSRAAEGKFQLTRLMRGVTYAAFTSGIFCLFQLTRLMRGVTA